ncbi:rubisco accumulation factor 1.1, chloroplastic-like [Rhodamnia argentea]|uniref:Rubisco accumulation factor 1.1, chloroplastic-like n=1 Tax=Rhodamnia argentea TaxID=178133 RepID=A0A8B8PJ48_9MYRT|nr:rubisco accumulation factor 1.1, chloroplastic-like [Rhodamnia argentea]
MLSLTLINTTHAHHHQFFNPTTTTILKPLTSPSLHHPHHHHQHHSAGPRPISASLNPPPQQQRVYQPFRPPPSPLPSQFRSLDIAGRLDILANRLGPWFEYAPLIPSLFQEGFTPPSLEEVTGISGVEQNRLVVAAKVRDSLIQSKTDPDVVAAFDMGGAELLYEIRLLSAAERSAAAEFIVRNKFDARGAQDLARAMKDFPRRRGDKGWEKFEYKSPGDCLSFMYYRKSREHRNPSEQRTAALEQAMSVAETEKAKGAILEELEWKGGEGNGKEGQVQDGVRVPVVRLKMGEVAQASSVAVLPVCRVEEREREVLEAPWQCKSEGEFGLVVADKGWARWVVLPGWEPVLGLSSGGVVVAFPDARALPWKVNRWYKEEAILVVADRGRKEVVEDEGFYMVAVDADDAGGGYGLKVERGRRLKEMGVEESLGTVVLVVRPPKEEIEDRLSDDDWE